MSMRLNNRVREWWGEGVNHDLDPGDLKAKTWEGKMRVMEDCWKKGKVERGEKKMKTSLVNGRNEGHPTKSHKT